jgi:hypothetical protein
MATTTSTKTDTKQLLDALYAEAKKRVPGYKLVAAHDGVPYDRITDGKRTVAYVTPQKRGLRLDLPLPGGKYEGVKVATVTAVPRAVQAVLANAERTAPKPKRAAKKKPAAKPKP